MLHLNRKAEIQIILSASKVSRHGQMREDVVMEEGARGTGFLVEFIVKWLARG